VKNQGKGAAVRAGFLDARKDYILICDADEAVPISDIRRLWAKIIDDPTSIVIGSRNQPDSTTVVVHKWYRKIMGRVFNTLLTRPTPGIKDTQCGFKLFPAPYAKALAQRQKEVGFAFDVEYLHIALRAEWRIFEVGVNWKHVDDSKVRIVRDSIRMLFSVFRILFRSRTGAYGAFPITL
jgi:dolichyl-phosphate beta-glucosyltransferase